MTAEQRAARVVKQAERATEAVLKAAVKEDRRRKRAEAAEAANEDKENVNPNVSAVVNGATKPPRYACAVVQSRRRVLLRMRKSE